MRFTSYEPAVDPQVMHPPAVRAPGDVYAYGTGGEGYAKMAAAIGQVNKVAAQRQDDLDAADVMQARNEMMTRLTEQLYGENGLFTTGVGEHAKGLMQRTTAAINETFADVGKKYNARVQFALKGNLNENMANFQRIAASKEMAEQKALAKESLAANLSGNVQQAALTWQVNGAPTMYVKSGERLLLAQAQREGWSGEMLASERQKMVTDVAAAAAGAAIENEDYERADEILFWMRNDMDAAVYYKLAREGKKKRDVREMDADVSRILSLPDVWDGQHFNQAKAREYVDEVYGKDAVRPAAGISPQDVARGFAPILGQEMVNKRDGCVEAALKGAQGFCPFYAREQEKGVVYVPTLLRDARADDSVVVEEYAPGMEVPAGAAIIYSPPGADLSDAENAYHVLVSDGRGGVFGNFSSAADYVDEDGYPVRGNGLVQHGASVEIGDDLVPALVIRPKESAPVSAYDPERRDALLRLVEARGGDLERSYEDERKVFLDGVLRAAQNAGSYGDAIAMLYEQDLDMRERNALEGAIAGYYHVTNGKGSGGGRGGSSGGSSGLGSGGRGRSSGLTEKEARAAYNKLQVLSIRLSNGEDVKPEAFVAARDAGNLIDDYELLNEEALQELRSLYNDQDFMSNLTDNIERRGVAGAYKDLVMKGADPIIAAVLVTKTDNYYLRDEFRGEKDNGT